MKNCQDSKQQEAIQSQQGQEGLAKHDGAFKSKISARMENLRKLQECNKRNITFKQTFYQLGMTDVDKPLRELNEKEEFSALANWVLNKLPQFHSMD